MKNNKAARDDQSVIEAIKAEKYTDLKTAALLYKTCFSPSIWEKVVITIIHKK